VCSTPAGQIEAWSDSFESGAEDLGHALLELMASNYFRLRAPRLFLLMQAVSTLEDATSTFGPGSNNLVNVWDSLMALLGFLWQPGKSLEQFDPGANRRPDLVAPTMDFLVRVAAVVLSAINKDGDKITFMKDVMTGWDGRGLDVDTTEIPLRSDVVSERMTSFSFGGETENASTEPGAAGRVNLTTAMVHAVEGGPALFLAVGGNADIEQPLETWKFSFKSRMDAAVAILVRLTGSSAGPRGQLPVQRRLCSQPRDPTPRTGTVPGGFLVPSSVGSRLDIRHLAFPRSLCGGDCSQRYPCGAPARFRPTMTASLPNDGRDSLRLPFELTIGYSSSRGLVLEGSPTGKLRR
jgi:hypothetical protein